MKNKVVWTMAISLLIFTGFMVSMSCLKDNGTFYIEDIEGQRDYLDVFPIEGIAGDDTHGITFHLEEGELSTKFYPFGTEQIRNLFFAEREGLTGIEKYSYDYFSASYLNDMDCYTDSAPSKDANIQRRDGIHEEALEEGYFDYAEFTEGETVVTDKIDVYLKINIWGMNTANEARVRTGMTLQDKEYYYTRGYDYNKDMCCGYASFNNMEIQAFCVKMGDAYYGIVGSNRECQGETALYRFKESGLREPKEWLPEPEETVNRYPLYQQDEYGEAEVLLTFPVDSENSVLGMLAVGDNYLGIFRTQKEEIYFELYDLEGNLAAQDLLTMEQGNNIDQVESEVIVWDEGDVSIYFRMYEIKQDDTSEVWECVVRGLYQVNEKGLKKMDCVEKFGGGLLTVCRNNLVFDVSMELDEKLRIPCNYRYQVYLNVINGDTGKVLYQGKFKTDFSEDIIKRLSEFNIAKNELYLEESMNKYSYTTIEKRQRQITDVVPINGRGGNLWWR